MENELNNEEQWYVMRAYKNEKKAEELLSGKNGLKYFIPKHEAIRVCGGKRVIRRIPVIHSLVFVYATQRQIVAFKRDYYNGLQFVTWTRHDDDVRYITIPDKQMTDFIRVCEQKEKKVVFYKPDEIQIKKGVRVRAYGETFDKVEGLFVKVARKRSRQFVVIIPEVLAASIEVDPEYLEIIE